MSRASKKMMVIILGSAFLSSGICFAEYVDKDALNKEEKTLQEVLAEEKESGYRKIDDFLNEFDQGYTEDIEEKFDDLLSDDQAVGSEDDEINVDSFEEFNAAFDKIIEADLADFDLIDIKEDNLEAGLELDKFMQDEDTEPDA